MLFAEGNAARFQLHLFVDSLNGQQSSHNLHVGRVDRKAIERFGLNHHLSSWKQRFFSSQRANAKVLFIVCGPEP